MIKEIKTHIDAASRAFDLYRQFYGQTSNVETAINFLFKRFEKEDSRLGVMK